MVGTHGDSVATNYVEDWMKKYKLQPGIDNAYRQQVAFKKNIIEMDDLHRSSVTHPGAVVIPAAWAVAEADDLRGRAFLEAVLRGYETCCRIGNAVGKAHYKVWHNTSTCGPFGSAMAAAFIRDGAATGRNAMR